MNIKITTFKYLIKILCRNKYKKIILIDIVNIISDYYSYDLSYMKISNNEYLQLHRYIMIIGELDLFINIRNIRPYDTDAMINSYFKNDDFGMYMIFKSYYENTLIQNYHKQNILNYVDLICRSNNLSLFIKYENTIIKNKILDINDVYVKIIGPLTSYYPSLWNSSLFDKSLISSDRVIVIPSSNNPSNKIYKYILTKIT